MYPRTADRKVDLFPEHLDAQSPAGLYGYQPDPATSEYPLALISPASERTISSTLSELPRPEVRLLMHPEDAAARGLSDGDEVRIFNALGEVRCGLQVGTWVRPGTVVLPKGLWRKHTANGYTANALAPDSLTDLGGGACFNDARVDVRQSTGRESRRPTAKVLAEPAKRSVHAANHPRHRSLHVLKLRRGNRHESPTTTATALTTLAASRACLVRRPLVGRPLFVGGATTLTGNLALLLSTHRSKSATFFARSVHSTLLLIRSPCAADSEVAHDFACPPEVQGMCQEL